MKLILTSNTQAFKAFVRDTGFLIAIVSLLFYSTTGEFTAELSKCFV